MYTMQEKFTSGVNHPPHGPLCPSIHSLVERQKSLIPFMAVWSTRPCVQCFTVKNQFGLVIFYFQLLKCIIQVLQISTDPIDNLLRLLKQPIFEKTRLVSIHDTTEKVISTKWECVWPWFIARCYQWQLLLSVHHKLTMLSNDILASLGESIQL
jgi:hypothetical protein